MKTTLSKLFDYQKFQKNPRLAAIVSDTEIRYDSALSDDALAFVSAAGEVSPAFPLDLSDNGLEGFKEGLQ